MVRQAIRQNQTKQPVSTSAMVPPPVGGWNARDSVAAMAPEDAVILDNWVARASQVELRRGYVAHVTGFANPVQRLIPFRDGAGDRLFAASGGAIYEVTNGGGVPAPLMSGFHSNIWQYTGFAQTTIEWTVACNGADPPIGFHNGAWANVPALSGTSGTITLDPTKLFAVFAHAGRLYYLEKNSMRVWTPAAGAIGGVCTLLDLASVFDKGGVMSCGGPWSYVVGLQADQFAAFTSTKGQVAVYQGYDPTDANNFSLIGVYDIGVPMGPSPLFRFGGDLGLITSDGIVPLSKAITMDRSQQQTIALTDKVRGAFTAAVRAFGAEYGWQGLLYVGPGPTNLPTASGGSLGIFNIPTGGGTAQQYVLNMMSGAWSRFTGINAECWEMAGQNIYFGAVDGVYQWDQGASDNGRPIIADVLGAFSGHGAPGRQKKYKGIRPMLYAPSVVQPSLDICVDFNRTVPQATPVVLDRGDASQPAMRFDWTGATGVGTVGAPRMQVNLVSNDEEVLWAINAAGDLVMVEGHPTDALHNFVLISPALPFDIPCQLQGFQLLFEPGAIIG